MLFFATPLMGKNIKLINMKKLNLNGKQLLIAAVLGLSLATTMVACSEKKTEEVAVEIDFSKDELSDSILTMFLDVQAFAFSLQPAAQQEALAIIASKGLTVEEYEVIAKKAENPLEPGDMSEEESNTYSEIRTELEAMNSRFMDQYYGKIETIGFSKENFTILNERINNEEALQQRITQLYMEMQGDNGPTGPMGDFEDMELDAED